MKQRFASVLATAWLVTGMAFVSVGSVSAAAAHQDGLGSDFWLAFPGNNTFSAPPAPPADPPVLTLFLTGPTATTGTVAAPGVGFSAAFTITPGATTLVTLPSTLDIQTSNVVANLGIHVTSNDEITTYGLSREPFTSDAYLGLPTNVLGNDYIVQGFVNGFASSGTVNSGSQFAIVGTQAGTTVTITPAATTDGHAAGVAYQVTLNQGATYQLRNLVSQADLSGSIVTSDKPIAVFAGHQCAPIFGTCDYIVEQMTPTRGWGTSFVTQPFAPQLRGDTFRILASADGTTLTINGVTGPTVFARGQFADTQFASATVITSNKPILVTQYAMSGVNLSGTPDGDPFEIIVPPTDQFLSSYTVPIPATGFPANFINVIAPTAALASLQLDGAAIPAASFTAIPGSTFSGAKLSVAVGAGVHTLVGAQPFGVAVYGVNFRESYGYPGGMALPLIPPVISSLTLAPDETTSPINTEQCVTATVNDQFGAPVTGTSVGFTVTGVNTASGAVSTAGDGTAKFCYLSTVMGDDTIVAAVGALSDSSVIHWTAIPPVATTLTLSPEEATSLIGMQHCVTATLKDQFGATMSGVSVDFDVTGANAASGSVSTGAQGTAQFCYTGTIAGDDDIEGAVGTLSDDAVKHWTSDTMTVSALGDVHGWIGLKNGDDQGARFDVQVELLKNGSVVATGIQQCITGVTRAPASAKEAIVPWTGFAPVAVSSGDVLALRVSARIGTTPGASTRCQSAHASAVGVRFYYDASNRNARFAATIGTNPSANRYLHSNGSVCNNAPSSGVTSRTLNTTAPTGTSPKCRDSAALVYNGGNKWAELGTWSLAPLP